MKIEKFLVIFLVLVCATAGYGQNTYKYGHYKGYIDKYPITMDLVYSKDTIFGRYYYDKIGVPFYIKGKKKSDGKFHTVNEIEFTNDKISKEYFELRISADGSLSGKWFNHNKSQSFAVRASEGYSSSAKMQGIIKKIKIYVNNDKSLPYLTLDWTMFYPKSIPNQEVLSKLISSMEKDLFYKICKNFTECIQRQIQNSKKEYLQEADLETIKEFRYSFYWQDKRVIIPLFNENNILSIEYFGYSYSGGAHGSYGSSYYNYDLTNGQPISYEDIFKAGTDSKILRLIKQEIEKQKIDVFNIDDVKLTNNIGITKAGILFSYGIYEISAFSQGEVQILLKYPTIKNYLTPDFKNKMHIKE